MTFGNTQATAARDCHLVSPSTQPVGDLSQPYVENTSYCLNSLAVSEVGYGPGTNTHNSYRRTLIDFDLGSSVPADAVVDSGIAQMTLKQNFQGPALVTQALSGGQAWADDATWNSPGSGGWNGGAGSPQTALGSSVSVASPGTAYGYDITSLVRSWQGGADQNGFVITMATETNTANTVMAFYSQEDGNSGNWPSLEVTYRTAPTTPEPVSASPFDSGAFVQWTLPSSDGGSPISTYRVSTFTTPTGPVKAVPDVEVSSCCASNVFGLTNGVTYYVDVTAVNAIGSATSNRVAVIPARPPSAPPSVTAVAGNASVRPPDFRSISLESLTSSERTGVGS
jgi:hypothetical protein